MCDKKKLHSGWIIVEGIKVYLSRQEIKISHATLSHTHTHKTKEFLLVAR